MQVSLFFGGIKVLPLRSHHHSLHFFSRRGRLTTSLHICIIFICEGVPPRPLPASPHPRQHTVRPRRRGQALAQSRSDPGRKMFACQRPFCYFYWSRMCSSVPIWPRLTARLTHVVSPSFGSGVFLVHRCRSAVLPQNGFALPLINADLEFMKGVGYEGSFWWGVGGLQLNISNGVSGLPAFVEFSRVTYFLY